MTMGRYATPAYWLAAVIVYGWFGSRSWPVPPMVSETNWDIWQHIAALQTLLHDPWSPPNPFIATNASSRLYGPVHVTLGAIGHWFGWTQVQAYQGAIALGLCLMAAGQFAFGRAYYRSPWGPLALLAAMLGGWTVSFLYPGLSSPLALIMDIGLPAGIAIGASLLSWAWTIRLLQRRSWVELAGFALFVAVQFANHQLGAGIALIGVACFGAFTPAADFAVRVRLALAVAAGLGLAALWPYFNPYAVLATVDRKTWDAGIDFYCFDTLWKCLVPAAIGVFGLRRSTGVLLALYAAAYLLGFAGSPTSHRFLAPCVIVLQIGLAELLLRHLPRRWPLIVAVAMPFGAIQSVLVAGYLDDNAGFMRRNGNLIVQGERLLADNPRGIAGFQAAAWPAVASGHKVYITPFTETLILDQPERLLNNARLFAPGLDQAQRLALARRLGVTVLIAERGVLPAATVARLRAQSLRVTTAGPLTRFDLEPQPAGATRNILPSASSVSR